MKELVSESVKELVNKYIIPSLEKDNSVGLYCHYELAKDVLSELIIAGLPIYDISLTSPDFDGYEKEFCIDIIDDGIFVEPFWSENHDRYLMDEVDIAFIHGDCSSKVLESIESNNMRTFFVKGYDEIVDKKEPQCTPSEVGEMHGYSFSGCDENGSWCKSFYSTKEFSVDEIKKILNI